MSPIHPGRVGIQPEGTARSMDEGTERMRLGKSGIDSCLVYIDATVEEARSVGEESRGRMLEESAGRS
jgi:hypothetical protein